MRKLKIPLLILAVAILTAFGCLSEAAAEHTVPINPGGVLQRKCGSAPYEGCVWCSYTTCYFVQKCDDKQCTYTTEPVGIAKGNPKTPVGTSPVINGKPVQAPPPPKGSNPTNATPIVTGKPVQAPPPPKANNPVILERGQVGEEEVEAEEGIESRAILSVDVDLDCTVARSGCRTVARSAGV